MHIAKEDDKQPRTCSDGPVQGLSFQRELVLPQTQFVVVVEQIKNSFVNREKDQGRKKRTRGDLVPERLLEVEGKEAKAINHYR